MIGLVVAALAAVPPVCQDASAHLSQLESYADNPAELDAAVSRLESELGARLQTAELSPAEKVAAVRARFSAACTLLGQDAAPSQVDRARLSSILARPEFAHARRRNASAMQQLMARLNALLFSLVETSGAQTFSSYARIAVLVFALALGIGVVLKTMRWAGRPRTASGAPDQTEPLRLEDPGTHWRLAEQAIAADPREAIRQGLLCLLSALERRRWARPDRVKTNRELAEELPSRGAPDAVQKAVAELVRWYDRTFYSLERVAGDEARRFIAEIGRVRQMVESAS